MTTVNILNGKSCLIQDSGNVAWYGDGGTGSGVTGDGTNYVIKYSADIIGIGSALNTGTGVATFPVTGMYLLGCVVQVSGINGSGTSALCGIEINGADYFLCELNAQCTVVSDKLTMRGSFLHYGTASQTCNMFVRVYGQSAGTVTVEGGSSITNFTGVLLR